MKKNTSIFVYILLGFGVIISGPRFSGAFAAAIGIDLIARNPIFGSIEIGSGWALALFEAMAIAYVASRFRQIQILDEDDSKPFLQRILPANAVYWVIVLLGQVILLLTIPAVSTVHLATQTFRVGDTPVKIYEILTYRHIWLNQLTWAWLFLTSAASTLFVFLIGLVMDDFGLLNQKQSASDAKMFEAYSRLKKSLPLVDPRALSKEANVTLKEAADFLDSLPVLAETVSAKDRLAAIKERSRNNGV